MGCGQSKIGIIYPKNKKNKSGSKKSCESLRTASVDQKNGNGNTKGNKGNNNGAEVNKNEDQNGLDYKSLVKKKPGIPGSGPLLHQAEISSSQLDFFKMLDEKIENGPDYDDSLDASARADRISRLLHSWELASMSWSNVGYLKNLSSGGLEKSQMNTRDSESMRNIIGGRPETPLIYMTANQVDGLIDESHNSSPTMSRHVLESISQSPSSKSATPPAGMSPTSQRHLQNQNRELKESELAPPIKVMNRATYPRVQDQVDPDYLNQQDLYIYRREQYLKQMGMVEIPSQSYCVALPPGKVITRDIYDQLFEIDNIQQHFTGPRKRDLNAAQMT